MSLHNPKDTLAFHASRPLCTYRDMSNVPCKKVAQSIKIYMSAPGFDGDASPEDHALRFYFLNHARSIISRKYHPLEPLKAFDLNVVENYHALSNKMAVRAFYYLLLICVRESRHVGKDGVLANYIAKTFGSPCDEFNYNIMGKGSVEAYKMFLNNPPHVNIGPFVRSLQQLFYKGTFGHSFGGPAWGAIADCLVNFVDGTYSPEMMLDTVFTLCHNNGAIYNKGMLYGGFTGTLYRILDIQRSGQIVEAILDDDEVRDHVRIDLNSDVNEFVAAYPGEFGKYVDWIAVEMHGAVHGPYHNEKAQQLSTYGMTPEQQAKIAHDQKLKIEEAMAKAEALKNFAKENFEYWPSQYAKVLKHPSSRAA